MPSHARSSRLRTLAKSFSSGIFVRRSKIVVRMLRLGSCLALVPATSTGDSQSAKQSMIEKSLPPDFLTRYSCIYAFSTVVLTSSSIRSFLTPGAPLLQSSRSSLKAFCMRLTSASAMCSRVATGNGGGFVTFMVDSIRLKFSAGESPELSGSITSGAGGISRARGGCMPSKPLGIAPDGFKSSSSTISSISVLTSSVFTPASEYLSLCLSLCFFSFFSLSFLSFLSFLDLFPSFSSSLFLFFLSCLSSFFRIFAASSLVNTDQSMDAGSK
mmetsp:Transcript_89789/g.149283  ORF Transcript_89789/g.149283 Transcript_89789/m.149283 type:complete len:271 (+) Transcript_89789:979-1791(+)